MKWGKLLLLFWLLSAPRLVFAQDAPQDPLLSRQTGLSSAVRSALRESRESMESLEQSYQAMIDSLNGKLDAQSGELTLLSERLTDTMNSFRALSAELENSNMQLEREKENARIRNRVLTWAGILFLINALAKIGAFICWGKGIKLPRWLDILI